MATDRRAEGDAAYLHGVEVEDGDADARLRPVWPCTLSGWRMKAFSEPPTRRFAPSAERHRLFRRHAGIFAGERERRVLRPLRREHAPDDHRRRGDTDVEAELADLSVRSARCHRRPARSCSVIFSLEVMSSPTSTPDGAGQHPDLDVIGGRRGSRPEAHRQDRQGHHPGRDRPGKSLQYPLSPPLLVPAPARCR